MRSPDSALGPVRAWRIRSPDPPVTPDHQAGIRTWVVNGPYHPFWSWWMVSVAHLRDIPGVPPAKKPYPEAEHEFLILSLNPERGEPAIDAIERGEDWGDLSVPKFLIPPDAVVHFHGVTDEQAGSICDAAVLLILGGQSPDSDYRSWWERNIRGMVEQYWEAAHG